MPTAYTNAKAITEKQLEANRRNAARSTGPRTEEGKRRSSLNAFRHGLTGQVTVMTAEERAAHDKFFNEYVAFLKPETPVERDLAQSAAGDAWRIKRAKSIEDNILALAHPDMFSRGPADVSEIHPELETALANARAFVADPKRFQLITLYEQRLHRSMEKSLALLRQYQAERKAAHDEALAEAMILAKASYFKEQPYDPAVDFPPENGFVLSVAEINAAIRRRARLEQAHQLSFWHYKPQKGMSSGQPEVKCIDSMPAAA